ncbi:serine/threonine-protein kinase [Streptomyces griseus]|uniref:Serine/threonine-protein kinase n=1 Tax=Streptomyces stephensoniae TaxID=3375367 RepID=A0ABU2W799_9ACTN|nr:serine/threonine-protein kinase [Streptomyces griseus]MDT0493179.1 serine/threonine-protein kinase [Streptomyces griseus]
MDQLRPDDPHRIGAYRLLGRLGEGGMGQVFLARSDRGRTVALKLVRRELAEQPEFRARFRQEVRAAHQVGGAWTAPVLDSDTEAAVPWVATGYVAGPSLHRVVSGRPGAPVAESGAYGPLPIRSVQLLGSGLAHALQHIHGAGLIHRDLKPSNVLLTIDGPRVIDFGIARALESLPDGDLTRTGSMIGSPGFMAPEQVRGERVTPACDVFCLGSVLAYAASGRLPFGTADSGGVHALMFRITQEDPDLTGVPAELTGLVRECLAKDPAARPSTDELLARLGEARADEPWLPATLIAQLGRQAVGLLDAEDPEQPTRPGTPPASVHALPTQVAPVPAPPAPVTPPPTPTPPPYAHQPQHQPPYGQGYGPGPAYNTPLPPAYFAPATAPTPVRRSAGATVALVAVAIVVAIGAGGSVYAFMNNKGGDTPTPGPSASASTGSSTENSAGSSTGSSTGASGETTGTDDEGGVPADYLGTWTASLPGERGASSRELTIRQGDVGDQVLSLTAKGPLALGATYHCEFTAPLAARPAAGEPVRIGPSTVSVGRPASSCAPGKATELTLLPDGTLRRATIGSGETVTYTRSD